MVRVSMTQGVQKRVLGWRLVVFWCCRGSFELFVLFSKC